MTPQPGGPRGHTPEVCLSLTAYPGNAEPGRFEPRWFIERNVGGRWDGSLALTIPPTSEKDAAEIVSRWNQHPDLLRERDEALAALRQMTLIVSCLRENARHMPHEPEKCGLCNARALLARFPVKP